MVKKENRFQKYKEIDGLDLIKEYDSKKRGIYFSAGNIRRYFCECGEVGTFARYTSPKCESCGSNDFVSLGDFYRWSRGARRTRYTRFTSRGADPLIIYMHVLTIDVDNDEVKVIIDERVDEFLRVEAGAVIHSRSISGGVCNFNDQKFIINEIKTKSPYYVKVKDIFEQLGEESLTELIRIMNLVDSNPRLKLKEFVKHKAIYNYINNREDSLWDILTNFQSFLDHKKIDEKLVPLLNSIYSNYYWYNFDDTFKKFAEAEEFHKDLIVKSIEQSLLTTHNIYSFLIDLENCKKMHKFEEVEEYLNDFLKENIIVYSSGVIREFINRVNFLRSADVEVNEHTLKTKQYKLARNYKELSDVHGIPKEKVDIFIDLIDESPLKALKFIKDRRKLTKKQVEEILAMQED